jgi:hypothetical protein
MMSHWNFDDPVSPHLGQGGQEAVHSIKGREIFHKLSFESPKRTGAVVDVFPGQPVPNAIPDLGNDRFYPWIVPFLVASLY